MPSALIIVPAVLAVVAGAVMLRPCQLIVLAEVVLTVRAPAVMFSEVTVSVTAVPAWLVTAGVATLMPLKTKVPLALVVIRPVGEIEKPL